MPIYALGDRVPQIHPTAFVHPDAVVIGDVRIGPDATIWPTAVLRADGSPITVGARTSIQDGTIVHCTSTLATTIGERCVVGHNAHLEGCTIHDDSLVGSGSIVLHRAEVGPHALVGAGALVSNDKIVPAFARALGIPAVVTTGAVAAGQFSAMADGYVERGRLYRASLRRLD